MPMKMNVKYAVMELHYKSEDQVARFNTETEAVEQILRFFDQIPNNLLCDPPEYYIKKIYTAH